MSPLWKYRLQPTTSSADVRIISATNRDLTDLVEKEKFREDLYYRLDVLKIQLPPLEERKEDIPLLAESFIRGYEEHSSDRMSYKLTDEAKKRLMDMTWNGNIRELKNACERLAVLSETCVIDKIDVERILEYKIKQLECGLGKRTGHTMKPGIDKQGINHLKDKMQERRDGTIMTREILDDLLGQGYNKARIAGLYGIDRTTLWRRMKKYKMM